MFTAVLVAINTLAILVFLLRWLRSRLRLRRERRMYERMEVKRQLRDIEQDVEALRSRVMGITAVQYRQLDHQDAVDTQLSALFEDLARGRETTESLTLRMQEFADHIYGVLAEAELITLAAEEESA